MGEGSLPPSVLLWFFAAYGFVWYLELARVLQVDDLEKLLALLNGSLGFRPQLLVARIRVD